MHEAPENWVWLARIRRPQGRKGEVLAEILTDFPEKFAERKHLWLIPATISPNKLGAPGLPASTPPQMGAPEPALSLSKGASRLGTGETSFDSPQALRAPELSHSGTGDLNPNPQNLGAPGLSHLETRETSSVLPPARPVELTNHWLHKGAIVLHFAGVDSISAAEELKGMIVAVPRDERALLAEGEAYIGDLIGCVLVDVSGPEPVEIGEIEDVDRTAGPVPLLVVRGKAGEVLIPFAKSYLRKVDLAAKRVEMALPEGLVELNVPESSPRAPR